MIFIRSHWHIGTHPHYPLRKPNFHPQETLGRNWSSGKSLNPRMLFRMCEFAHFIIVDHSYAPRNTQRSLVMNSKSPAFFTSLLSEFVSDVFGAPARPLRLEPGLEDFCLGL
jgi:hypothetical protein